MTTELIGHVFAMVGLTSPAILFIWLDKYLRQDLKKSVADSVFGTADQSAIDRLVLFNNFVQGSLGSTWSKKLTRLVFISVMSIGFVYSLQYVTNNSQFLVTGDLLASSFRENLLFFILVALSFVIVDVISFIQTLTFSRLAGNCKNVFEIAFLALADIAASLFLVIILLPVLIFVNHKITTVPRAHDFYLSFNSGMQRQDISLYDLLQMIAPSIQESDAGERKSEMELAEKSDWFYSIPYLSISEATKKLDEKKAVEGLDYNVGTTIYFERGKASADATATRLAKIIEGNEYINSANAIYSGGDMFGNAFLILKVSAK